MLRRIRFSAMGTTVELVVPAGAGAGVSDLLLDRLFDEAPRFVAEWEARLSRFLPDSDVGRLNANPGRWVSVHPGTLEVLSLAEEARRATDGWFHPGLGRALREAGYGATFTSLPPAPALTRTRGPAGTPTDLDDAGGPDSAAGDDPRMDRGPRLGPAYELDPERGRARVEPGFEIDLGGIAKGWIVEQLAAWWRGQGLRQFVVSAGGDMVCAGRCGERPWRVGIDEPFGGADPVLTLDVWDLAVATSAVNRRRWRRGDEVLHHLLDPGTGRPAVTDVVSCTVLHERLVVAEVLAKVALLRGTRAGRPWLAERPTRGWVMIREDGEVQHGWRT
ncbi:FAD:protein FMN transferase [Alicyclobacillus sp.]|uniref:FAD:protein FMN transferase n=1 Tax=Alicyclobacillus sp. TaxID=61169 RepID=UPI0025C0B2D9|nr:FAD:protein FMN transferase [Alicyclobacillus sp.]MCL6516957.1 FAD:protein FMN transferase [Alicyclobacillus sp.]